MKTSDLNSGIKVKFKLKYAPFLTGLGTIKKVFIGKDIPCVYQVEIEEVQGHYTYMAGDEIFVFFQEIEKIVYFD